VTGRSNESAAGGPTPGKTPTSVPTRTPAKQYSRLIGDVATLKPKRRSLMMSMTIPDAPQNPNSPVGIWAFRMTLKTNSDATAVINPPRIEVFQDWGSTTFNNSVIRRKVLIRNPNLADGQRVCDHGADNDDDVPPADTFLSRRTRACLSGLQGLVEGNKRENTRGHSKTEGKETWARRTHLTHV